MNKILIGIGLIAIIVVVIAFYLGYTIGSNTNIETTSSSPSTTPTTTRRIERLDITATYVSNATYRANGYTYYEVTVQIENKGTTRITIDKIFVNNIPISPNKTNAYWIVNKQILDPGDKTTLYVYLNHNNYHSGQILQIIIHTTTGGMYPTQVTLP